MGQSVQKKIKTLYHGFTAVGVCVCIIERWFRLNEKVYNVYILFLNEREY